MSGMRQRCLLSSLLFKIVLKVLAEAMRQERETKGIQIGKEEIEIPLFALPSKCQKASRNNKHIQQYARIQNQAVKRSVAFLYTYNKRIEKSGRHSHSQWSQ